MKGALPQASVVTSWKWPGMAPKCKCAAALGPALAPGGPPRTWQPALAPCSLRLPGWQGASSCLSPAGSGTGSLPARPMMPTSALQDHQSRPASGLARDEIPVTVVSGAAESLARLLTITQPPLSANASRDRPPPSLSRTTWPARRLCWRSLSARSRGQSAVTSAPRERSRGAGEG